MKNSKIKWGIIGGGRIVNWFLDDFKLSQNIANMELVAIWNRTQSKAQELAKKHNILRVENSVDELLLNNKLDIVYIGTNHETHYEFAKKVLQHKIAVYCEKPITLSLKKAIQLYDLAKKNNVLFFDGIKTGVIPAFIEMQKDIKNGIIGELEYVYAPFNKMSSSGKIADPEPNIRNGGMLFGSGVYALFITHALLGIPLNHKSLAYTYKRNKDVARAYISMEYPNQKVGIALVSDHSNGSLQAEIVGSKGHIKMAGLLDKYNESYHLDILHAPFTYRVYNSKFQMIKNVDMPFSSNGEGLRFLIDHCYDLLINGQVESNIVTRKISLSIIDILEKSNTIF